MDISSPPSCSTSDIPNDNNKRSSAEPEIRDDFKKKRIADSALVYQRAGVSLKVNIFKVALSFPIT